MRRSNTLLIVFFSAVLCLIFTLVDAKLRRQSAAADLQHRSALVAELGLTDLALFTEARYTRHPSQSDLHSAFQDHPMALEHFPSGSLIFPPQRLGQ
ncbi:MAG: hypothetical protein JMN24_06715 [gamma proteobacterium endosymbiont of Lamellibrachia anaximandri]|nr:hypothetical protein [gamma proteobacterium endosymbiont of Lamellibrachia anaximandri]MBL3617921.1 hypothetical protein [gamma proteobacterium endosymbiont of Lamellibrachia anaximandri]